jgi:predicted amidophosphoribosyltransferase
MKIIKKCAMPIHKLYDIICHDCHSKIEFIGTDAERCDKESKQFCFKCPICKEKIWRSYDTGREPDDVIDDTQKNFDKHQI